MWYVALVTGYKEIYVPDILYSDTWYKNQNVYHGYCKKISEGWSKDNWDIRNRKSQQSEKCC